MTDPEFNPHGDTIDQSDSRAPVGHPGFDSTGETLDSTQGSAPAEELVQPRNSSSLLSDPLFREHVTLVDTGQEHSSVPQAGSGASQGELTDTRMEPPPTATASEEGVEQSLGTRRVKRPSAIKTRMPKRIGNYEPIRELGRGGMGVVYEARHLRTERRAAVKVLHNRGVGASETAIARFHIEARAAGRLKHPNIVAVFDQDLDAESEQWFLAMDMIEGETLFDRVSRDGPYPEMEGAELLLQLTDAIEHAHSKQVLHRDLKPHNVILDATQGGRPLLTDFGLAKLVGEDSNVSQAGPAFLGTPGFMPPEQAGTGGTIDQRSDVYSLGATLYFVLTGKPPFTGGSVAMILSRVVKKAAPRPTLLRPELNRDLETIVLKCLEKEAQHRYANAGELKADLERFLQAQKIEARRTPGLTRLWRWAGRNMLVTAVVTSALLLAASGLTAAGVLLSEQTRASQVLADREARSDQNEQRVDMREARVDESESQVEGREQRVDERERELAAIPPTLEVRSPPQPTDGVFVTRERFVEVRAWVPDEDLLRVTLNGTLLPLGSEAGIYTTRWELAQEGENRATLIAVDTDGNETEKTLIVLRDTTAPTFEWTVTPVRFEIEGDEDAVLAVRVRIAPDDAEETQVSLSRIDSDDVESELPLNALGRAWEAEVPLALGPNHLRVTVTDTLGNENAEERIVNRSAPRALRGAWWPVHAAQRAFALETGSPVQVENDLGMSFALIPSGRFSMGSPPHEVGRGESEFQHTVELSRGFYLAKTEVTWAQLRRLLPDHSQPPATGKYRYRTQQERWGPHPLDGDDLPAVGVTWEQATRFCQALGELEEAPDRYRLPTEAEWEYACRAGTTGRWFWGDDLTQAGGFANVAGDQARDMLGLGNPPQRGDLWFPLDDGPFALAAPVARFAPNPFGLYDMVGNVGEWCSDRFGPYSIKFDTRREPVLSVDPKGPDTSRNDARVFRGGCWQDRVAFTRSAHRTGKGTPRSGAWKHRTLGFRVVRQLTP